jgi:hypothetical protein
MTPEQKLLSALGLAAFVAVVALALSGYVHPAMLIDFANIRICS